MEPDTTRTRRPHRRVPNASQEAFRRKGKLYLVFEYVPRNLLEVLEERPGGLDPTLVRRYIWQLVKAIAWCHRHDIVHRDIKPENLLVGPDDTRSDALKLCDFGFARQLKRHKPDEVLTDYVATRWYRAPELLLGSEKYGTEVDTWAIGCIMGELTDGQPLFPGESDGDQLHIVCKSMGAMTGKQRETLSNNQRINGVRFPRESNGSSRDRGMDHLRSRYSNKLNNAALRFIWGTLAMDPAERLTWQGMLTHPYFEGEDGWTERSPLSENTVPVATRGPERLSDTSTSSIERKRSSSCAPVTSPMTPKVSERRERRMKENAERLRVETEAQARTRSIKAETAETGRRESELEAAAREARAARERRERERAEREERERVAKAKAAATESVYSTSAAASRRRREKFGVGTSSSLNARLPTRAPGANPIYDGSKLGGIGLTHDADATAEYVVGTRQYGTFGAKPGGIAELRSRYASRVLGAATHGHSRSSYAPPEVFVDEDDAAARGTGGGRHHLARLSSNVAANGLGGTMNPMNPSAAARKSLMDRDERVQATTSLASAAPRAQRGGMQEPASMLLNGTSMSIGVSGRAQTRGGMGVGGAPTRLAPLKMSAGLGTGASADPYGSLGRRVGGFEERGPRRGTVGGGLGAGWR